MGLKPNKTKCKYCKEELIGLSSSKVICKECKDLSYFIRMSDIKYFEVVK